jgi:hypothetical protein
MQAWNKSLITAVVGVALTTTVFATSVDAQGRGRGRGRGDAESSRSVLPGRAMPRKYEEPAFARGHAAGKERGRADAKKGDRYDPVASREYRDGDLGYETSYGSRDAYKPNYRAGFRQGYEEGYRKRGSGTIAASCGT